MIVAVKFGDKGKFLSVLGIFTNIEQLKAALAVKVVRKTPDPKRSVEERQLAAAKAPSKLLADDVDGVLKFFDAPPDDYGNLLEDCPEITLE